MSSSRNWSHNSFEDTMEKFVPLIKFWWMEYMKIIPVNYSEWSDTLYVIVEFELNQEGIEMTSRWNYAEQAEVLSAMSNHLRKYFNGFLNTNIQIKEFRRPASYSYS